MRKSKVAVPALLLGLLFLPSCGNQEDALASAVEVIPVDLGDWQGSDFYGAAEDSSASESVGENSPASGSMEENTEEPAGADSEEEYFPEKVGYEEGDSAGQGQTTEGRDGILTEQEDSSAEELPVTEESVPGREGEVRITVSAAGDVTLGNYAGQGYEVSFRQTYDQGVGDDYFFENVTDIFDADDLTLVNLEGPLTRSEDPREGQTYCISGDPEYVNILTAGSVEAVSMGNNHRLDYKEQGTADTVAALEAAGIPYAYDDNYCLYETKGIRIGIVSVNEVGQGAGVEKFLREGIEKLREEGADLVLACCHWGIEREYYPEDYQKSLGKKCIDWGYDLVIGHHPHVLQGIEEYQGRFIVYSLGNFCFGANRNPPDKDCMIFQQTFTFVDGEKKEDREIRVIPCLVSSVSGRNDYKPTPAEGSEADRILDKINEYSRDMGVVLDMDGCLEEETP